jgi:hypothetical protein
MFGIILIFLLLWAGLVVILWAGSLWLQGYIYSEPAPQLVWSAPVAGTVLAVFLAIWCAIDYKSPGRYGSLFESSSSENPDRFPELWAVKGATTTRYTLTKDAMGRSEYLDKNGKPIPTHPDRIIVKENGEEIAFEPERDANGNYKMRTGRSLLYRDARGREMSEDSPGQLSTIHWGVFLACWFLNFLHFALWFVCLWLLLRFQWSHAFGLALIFWLIMTIVLAVAPFHTWAKIGSTSPASRLSEDHYSAW